MTFARRLTASLVLALTGASALFAPAIASAAPHHHGHQVCHWQHHHKVCHWVR